MGFFSDLKEDLSQAVNELKAETEQLSGAESKKQGEKEPEAKESGAKEPEPETDDSAREISLEAMLDSLEESAGDPFSAPESASLETDQKEPAQEDGLAETDPRGFRESQTEPRETQDPEMESLLERMLAETPLEEPSQTEPAQEDRHTLKTDSKGAENHMEINTERIAADETSVITEGMTITGDINTEGSIDVIGTVNGNIDAFGKLNITGHVNGNSKASEIYAESAKINGEVVSEGAVKIGASSVVIGNISATSAAIAGAVKGDIDVRGPVILDASAIVMGNIKSKSVQINNGAVIEGMCSQCYADVNPTSFFEEYKPEAPRKTRSSK